MIKQQLQQSLITNFWGQLWVRFDTAYFTENLKLKIIKRLLFMRGLLFIYLNALFMSHEHDTKCWSIKKKGGGGLKCKTSKRGRDPNTHYE